MLKSIRKDLQKIFGEKEPEMGKQDVANVVAGAVQQDAQAQMAADMAAQAEQLQAALSSLQEVKSQLDAAVAEKNALLAKLAADKNAARMGAITKAVGEAKAQAVFEATKAMADADFEAIVKAMAGTYEAEASTPLFKEVGAQAEADASQVAAEEESQEMKLLKVKYQSAKK